MMQILALIRLKILERSSKRYWSSGGHECVRLRILFTHDIRLVALIQLSNYSVVFSQLNNPTIL